MNKRLSPVLLLCLLTGLNLLNYLDRFVVPAVLGPLKTDLHLSDGELGRINTIFMVGYFVAAPFFGYLGDRVSRKWLIAAGIFVWSLGTVLSGTAQSYGMLLFYRVLVGVGEASYGAISPSLISDSFPAAKRNNALTIFYVAIPVGAALGNIIGGYVAEHHGWRSAFIWAGAPGLLLALSLLPFAEPQRGAADGGGVQAKPTLGDFLAIFRLPRFHLLVWGYTAYTFALGAFGVWGPTFLHRVHAVPNEAASRFFGVVLVISGLVGTMLGGFVATAWRKRNPGGYAWLMGWSVLLATPFAIAAFVIPGKAVSMSCLAAAMFFLFLSTGPVNTMIVESVPVNLRASAMAASIFMIHLFGDMWSPEIVGHLSDQWSDIRKAVMILPGALVVCAVLWLVLARKLAREDRVSVASS
jgi:MFS family permease